MESLARRGFALTSPAPAETEIFLDLSQIAESVDTKDEQVPRGAVGRLPLVAAIHLGGELREPGSNPGPPRRGRTREFRRELREVVGIIGIVRRAIKNGDG